MISDGLKACKRSDPKLDECLLNMLRQTKPQLMQGKWIKIRNYYYIGAVV